MDPDPRNTCPVTSGNVTQYWISFHSGSVVYAQSVSLARCTAGRCSYTFEPPSNPPSSYDSVSVAAENVVGVGAARTCTTQGISEFISVKCIVSIYNSISFGELVKCGIRKNGIAE